MTNFFFSLSSILAILETISCIEKFYNVCIVSENFFVSKMKSQLALDCWNYQELIPFYYRGSPPRGVLFLEKRAIKVVSYDSKRV